MRKALVYIEILSCTDCPLHFPAPNDRSELVPYCSAKDRLIGSSLDTIPNWCPFLVETQEGGNNDNMGE